MATVEIWNSTDNIHIPPVYLSNLFFGRVWSPSQRLPVCPHLRLTGNSAVTALISDEQGVVWVGTQRGDVKRVMLQETKADGGAVLAISLIEAGSLKHQNTGKPERMASTALGESADQRWS